MGINTNMAWLYGRAPLGQRVKEKCLVNTPANTSVIVALGAKGLVSCLCVEGSVDTECFCSFIEQMLAPELKPGQVVLMDNVAVHKHERVAQAIERAGAGLVYLPTYSPDYNPLEEGWSKIKTCLRARAARTKDTLLTGLKEAIATVTPQDIIGWFSHAGYSFTCNWNPL